MNNSEPTARFTYLGMEMVILGSVLLFVVSFHFPILRRQWRALLLTTLLVTLYGSALDAWAIQNDWGWFNPALTSGIWFGTLLLEELIFWLGTGFVTAAMTLVMAEGVERRIAWWALLVAFAFPSWLWLNHDETIFSGVRE